MIVEILKMLGRILFTPFMLLIVTFKWFQAIYRGTNMQVIIGEKDGNGDEPDKPTGGLGVNDASATIRVKKTNDGALLRPGEGYEGSR